MEDRLHIFENAFAVLFPGSDIEAIANSLLRGGEINSESEEQLSPIGKKDSDANNGEPSPEAVPQQADGFDWVEREASVGDLADGMAALSVRPEGAGYLGKCNVQ